MNKKFCNDFAKNPNHNNSTKLLVEVSGDNSVDLPITIRNRGLHLIGHSNSNTTITLDPDLYVIQLHRPDGMEQSQLVELEKGQVKKIKMSLSYQSDNIKDRSITLLTNIKERSGDTLNTRSGEQVILAIPKRVEFNSLEKSFASIKVKLEENENYTQSPARNPNQDWVYGNIEIVENVQQNQQKTHEKPWGCLVRVLQFDGSMWAISDHGIDKAVIHSETIADVSQTTLKFRASNQLQVLEVRKPQGESTHLVLPLSSNSLNEDCTVKLWDNGNDFQINCDFTNSPRASLVLDYLSNGSYDFAANISGNAEDTLFSKIKNPVEAALGGYVLLRIGDIERLHNWPSNLSEWFPNIADGAIIAAELVARKNKNIKSFDLFLEASQRGLPMFREGLSILVARLRSYTLYDKKLNISSSKRKKLQSAYKLLAEIALFSDNNLELLSFKGPSLVSEDAAECGWQFIIPSQLKQQGIELSTVPVFFQGETDV